MSKTSKFWTKLGSMLPISLFASGSSLVQRDIVYLPHWNVSSVRAEFFVQFIHWYTPSVLRRVPGTLSVLDKYLLNETFKTFEEWMTTSRYFPILPFFSFSQCVSTSAVCTQGAAFTLEAGDLERAMLDLGKESDQNRIYFIIKVNFEVFVFTNIFLIDFSIRVKGYI